MKFRLELLQDATLEPFTLAQLKTELRTMTWDMEDEKLTRLLAAGRQWFEDYTGLALVDQSWRLCIGPNLLLGAWAWRPVWQPRYWDAYYGDILLRDQTIMLRRSPVLAITAVYTVAADGTRTLVDSTTYQLRDSTSKWPEVIGLNPLVGTNEELQIEFRAGYADQTGSPQTGAEVIPARLTQPIILWITAMYEQDKDTMDRTLKAAELLADRFSVNMNFA